MTEQLYDSPAIRATMMGIATYASVNSSITLVADDSIGAGGTVVINGQSTLMEKKRGMGARLLPFPAPLGLSSRNGAKSRQVRDKH